VDQPAPVPIPREPVGVPGKTMIDLIPLIDPVKDKVHGNRWEVFNNELHCKGDTFVPRIEIPYLPPEEYDFIVVFSQPKLRNGISLIMPKPNAGGSFFWYLGSGSGTACGFAAAPNNKELKIPGLIQPNTAYTTKVEVRRTSVAGFVDGKECIRHQTDYADLTCDKWRAIRDRRLLAVACDDPTVFHFVRIVEVTGTGSRAR
jgi:hypothetical protein